MRAILWSLVFLTFNGYAQSTLEIYLESEFFIEHKNEMLSAYQELKGGEIGPVLINYTEDTVNGAKNRKWIEELLASEDFKLSEEIDTIYVPGTGSEGYLTLINVRRLKENADRTFTLYSVDIGIHWNKEFEVFGRRFGYHEFEIETKEDWKRFLRKHSCPQFLPSN